MTKSDREVMEILEAYDLTRCAHSAAQLAGVDEKTVARYVAIREAGGNPFTQSRRVRSIDPFLPKVEEWVDQSKGKIRADKVHERLLVLGYGGNERTTRRAVAEVKTAWRAGHRRAYRPWIPEPGMWLQFDWGEGPRVRGRRTCLFCAWLAWSRFRVVIPTWDQTLGTLVSCIDTTLRRVGGVPTYLLTDNPKTVTVEHIAGVPVRHPEIVAAGRHYGCTVETCQPYDPESKGGAECTVKVAKADLVPTSANLLDDYGAFGELVVACELFNDRVNHRIHRETAATPVERLAIERRHLHLLPAEPYALALGEERTVDECQTIRFGSVRYSTPPGHVETRVWCRVVGEELAIVARTPTGLREIARHRLSTPGNPSILDEHYPGHPGGNLPRPPKIQPRTKAEASFLAIGPGAHSWLVEAAAAGTPRVRAKMARAVELAALVGTGAVDEGLGLAAINGRFDDDDLPSIVDHRARVGEPGPLVRADETHSAQHGTSGWGRLGQ
ncbi:MAG: IS21 family transposase [Sporichthyaceae bacterium]|nr:IS21 family transposase [Sporichthyaceae bacterium]